MTSILSLHDIEQMALQHGLEVSVYTDEASARAKRITTTRGRPMAAKMASVVVNFRIGLLCSDGLMSMLQMVH